jgi:hypothetical protein
LLAAGVGLATVDSDPPETELYQWFQGLNIAMMHEGYGTRMAYRRNDYKVEHFPEACDNRDEYGRVG